mmetsp:Transcript_1737/g.2559  ORF Transcript_1737/g.2559 Transcript_1737/m.2559 type:complete len:944 (+) Transcript_1737:199-3030(+)
MPEFVGSPKRRGVAWKCLVRKVSSVNQWENWGKEKPTPALPPEPPARKKRKHPSKPQNARSYGRKRRRRRDDPRKKDDRNADTNDSDCSVISPQDIQVRKTKMHDESTRPIKSSMLPKTNKTAIFVSPPVDKKVDNNTGIEPIDQSYRTTDAQKMAQMDEADIESDGSIVRVNLATPSRDELNKNDKKANKEVTEKVLKFETPLLHGLGKSTKLITKENKTGERGNCLSSLDKPNAKNQSEHGWTGKEDNSCHVHTSILMTNSLRHISSQKKVPIPKAKIVTYKRSQVMTNVRTISSVSEVPKKIVSVLRGNGKIISGLNDSDSEDSGDNVTITTDDAIVSNTPKPSHRPVVKYWQSKRRNRKRSSPSLWMTQIMTQETSKVTETVEGQPSSRESPRKKQGVPQLENALAKHPILDRETFQQTNGTHFIVQENFTTPLNNENRRYVSVLERINCSDSEELLSGQISQNDRWKCPSSRILEVCYNVDSSSKRYNLLLEQLQWDATLLRHLLKVADGRNTFPKPLKLIKSKMCVSLKMELPPNFLIAGTLLDVIQTQFGSGKGPIPECVVCWLVSQIADILLLLHRNGISHNNLSLGSFILGQCQETKKWMLMMIGLGLNGVACSVMLPKEDRPHFFLHDAFSLAALIWCLLTSGVPFLFEINEAVSIDSLRSVEYNLSLRGRTVWTKLLKLLVNESSYRGDIFPLVETPLKELKKMVLSKSEEQERCIDNFFEAVGKIRVTCSYRDENDGLFKGLGISMDQLKVKLKLNGESAITSSVDSTKSRNKTLVYKPAASSSQQIQMGPEKRMNMKDIASTKRRLEPKKVPIQRRQSRRKVLYCGKPKCKVTWPDNGHMWFLVYSWTNTLRGKGNIPLIPANHPMHLVCTKCLQRAGTSTCDPLEVLADDDKAAIKDWNKYEYFWGTKGEYVAKLDKKVDELSGEVSET